jgi:hypothetical protein
LILKSSRQGSASGKWDLYGISDFGNVGNATREGGEITMNDKPVIQLDVEELEERIAPSALGNPGNNNPPLNNTNNPGNEGTGGQVSTG